MRRLAVLIALVALVAGSAPRARAEFRGFGAIEATVRERLAADASFNLGDYLGERPSPFRSTLPDLLGTYDGTNVTGTFRNGDPNVMNALLWHVLLGGLAGDVAAGCGDPAPLALRPLVSAALRPLCAWPAAEARDEALLREYWLAILSFDAPWEEFEAWRDFFLGPEYAAMPAYAALRDMTLAMTLNPHFLLKH